MEILFKITREEIEAHIYEKFGDIPKDEVDYIVTQFKDYMDSNPDPDWTYCLGHAYGDYEKLRNKEP